MWFDLTSEGSSLELVAGGWYAEREAPGRAAIAVGMPTFNRPTDCVATLQALGDDPLVRDSLTAVIIPDQGTSKVRDQPGFDEAAAALGDKLRIIDQPNLGGSGGYARIMYEALENTDAEQILFMDDDIVLEPDSVLRALAFSRFAREDMLVGGQMLSLQARSHLHAMGEVVDRGTFFWQLAPHTTDDHDFAVDSLRETLWMHRRTDVDYNAWWMCLIPRSVAERIGLPLPLFIKWDDCEYGLRAGSHGIPTATVPGVGIWHLSFVEKDDSSDWQAYFHVRNRLVVGALHGPDNPRAMLADSLKRTLRHLFLLEYSTIALHHMAMRDFLSGPKSLFGALPTALGAVRATRAEFPDGTVHRGADEVPRSPMGARESQLWPKPPVGKVAQVAALARGLAHQLRPVDRDALERPQREVPCRAQPVVHALPPRRCRGDDLRRLGGHLPQARPRDVLVDAARVGGAARRDRQGLAVRPRALPGGHGRAGEPQGLARAGLRPLPLSPSCGCKPCVHACTQCQEIRILGRTRRERRTEAVRLAA